MSSNKRNTPRNISEQEDKSASKNTPPTDYKIPVIKVNPSKTSGDESNDDPAKKQPLESLEFTKFEDLPDGCTCTTVCSCPGTVLMLLFPRSSFQLFLYEKTIKQIRKNRDNKFNS